MHFDVLQDKDGDDICLAPITTYPSVIEPMDPVLLRVPHISAENDCSMNGITATRII